MRKKISRVPIISLAAHLSVILLLLTGFATGSSTRASAAITDFVYVTDKYQGVTRTWQPGQIFGADIFNTDTTETGVAKQNQVSDGAKLLAPGTKGHYSFTVHNQYTKSIKYTLIGRDENIVNDEKYKVPMEYQMQISGGPWITPLASDGVTPSWTLWNKVFPLKYSRTIDPGQTETIDLDWRWVFERGKDGEDTEMGNAAVNKDLYYGLYLQVIIEYDEDSEGGGGAGGGGAGTTTSSTGSGTSGTSTSSLPPTNSGGTNGGGGTGSSSEPRKKKPAGTYWWRLPQTGEDVAKSSLVLGVIILLIVAIIWKNRKRKKEA